MIADGYRITEDKQLLQVEAIKQMLNDGSYWARNRTKEQIIKSIENSLCFGLFHGDNQIGFARVVTDGVTMFYLCDVIVSEKYRGKGLGKILMDAIFSNKEIEGVFGMLMTKSAHGLYRKYGFRGCEDCQERFMVLGSGWSSAKV
jgi:ribosomal protein S18 acetylase RimI-like enzyme